MHKLNAFKELERMTIFVLTQPSALRPISEFPQEAMGYLLLAIFWPSFILKTTR